MNIQFTISADVPYSMINYSVIIEMRDWLLDCCTDDEDVDFISSCTRSELCGLVDRHYEGGVRAFLYSIDHV